MDAVPRVGQGLLERLISSLDRRDRSEGGQAKPDHQGCKGAHEIPVEHHKRTHDAVGRQEALAGMEPGGARDQAS